MLCTIFSFVNFSNYFCIYFLLSTLLSTFWLVRYICNQWPNLMLHPIIVGGNSTSAGARWLSHANFEFRLIIKNVSTDSDGTYYVLCESCWGLIVTCRVFYAINVTLPLITGHKIWLMWWISPSSMFQCFIYLFINMSFVACILGNKADSALNDKSWLLNILTFIISIWFSCNCFKYFVFIIMNIELFLYQ